jgi:hypothetical protein
MKDDTKDDQEESGEYANLCSNNKNPAVGVESRHPSINNFDDFVKQSKNVISKTFDKNNNLLKVNQIF